MKKRNSEEIQQNQKEHDDHRNEFIVNHDRVYITAKQQVTVDCKLSETSCCAYVEPSTFGGICTYEASQELLRFPERNHKQDHDIDRHDDNNQRQGNNKAQHSHF